MKKILISIIVVAILASTLIYVFATANKAASNTQTANTAVVSTALATAYETTVNTQAANTAVVSTAVQADITFAKKTLYNPDGSIATVIETWADPETHDQRLDYWSLLKVPISCREPEAHMCLRKGQRT